MKPSPTDLELQQPRDIGEKPMSFLNAFLSSRFRPWLMWLGMNAIIGGPFLYALFTPQARLKTFWTPGQMTAGHYQIELDCDACHSPVDDSSQHSSANVMQDACNRCHAEELENSRDTHPSSKFNDPTNADRLQILDAQNCLSCHQEHLPERTLSAGLTMPKDYCWHCHKEVADNRPSHKGMAFDSCATAGCHNYHDNRALFEKHLNEHFGEPDTKDEPTLLRRNYLERWKADNVDSKALLHEDADAPREKTTEQSLMDDWAFTAHAAAGVNCSGCHTGGEKVASTNALPDATKPKLSNSNAWSDQVGMQKCGECHESQVDTFLLGKHGMRLNAGMSPMTPGQARLPMNPHASHTELSCSACHDGHKFDTQYAAVDACLKCHADDHSLAYSETAHSALWQAELTGSGNVGSGVTCATCHMPRLSDRGDVWVNHNQNAVLRPNETMARDVCGNCHSLEYSLSSLADRSLIQNCFGSQPTKRNESVRMAHEWFESRAKKRKKKQ